MLKYILLLICFSSLLSCGHQKSIEKNISFSKHVWAFDYQPWLSINITDSTALYNIYALVRHENDFKYNNLVVNYSFISPGDSAIEQKISLPLGKNSQWYGDTVGSIIENRIKLNASPSRLRAGINNFAFQQLMPQSNLQNIVSIGVSVQAL